MERLLKSLGRNSTVHDAPSLIADIEHEDAPAKVPLEPHDLADRTTRDGARTELQPPYGHPEER
jgi:hypothetical protein